MYPDISELDRLMQVHYQERFSAQKMWRLTNQFHRFGFLAIRDIVPDKIRTAVRDEVMRLLGEYAERRDLYLATTGNTPRRMSVIPSEIIAEHSELICTIYHMIPLKMVLESISGEAIFPCPSKDEEFLITRQERAGDTHGWHWGDYSFALIWIVETPPVSYGGMLQCVPHTRWDKLRPCINEYLCENLIATYGFTSGDIYLLRTDTTLHRTVPLTREATRIILNMTWASSKEMTNAPQGNDRWWEDANATAATPDIAHD